MAVSSEKELFAKLDEAKRTGQLLQRTATIFEELYFSYKAAVLAAPRAAMDELAITRLMAQLCGLVAAQQRKRHVFGAHHRRVTEPFDYYEMGQRYISALVDYEISRVGHIERWRDVQAWIAQGHNVILLANHQSEADPAVVSLLLESAFPRLAEDITFVAGDRVVGDPICIPFSLGRNLFCVHSKKHMDDHPELKSAKTASNRKTLLAMQKALAHGGQLLWVAPSGGRDRSTDGPQRYVPDAFDPGVVELMATLLRRSKQPGHLVPMAMFSYTIMPPPPTVERLVGEWRSVARGGVGISACAELDLASAEAQRGGSGREQAARLCEEACHAVRKEFFSLRDAVEGRLAGEEMERYVQPWKG
ncbi:hypothetical protein H632_c100p1 [Helicosporidium sp. ATCC 50920]|nr:hypothetical protein H632_c100p1 [Helicosporidium sp. ATCC 50920]|eukprot:KDD76799.1 hypothetical protein H632_c100p1 [Helicosporidium sp. ATCC 50920]